MASTKKHKKLVRLKLDTLEQQRTLVHDAVDKYVNKVVKEAKDWLDNTDGQWLTSKNLTQLIDNAVEFLVEKETEISDEDEEEKYGETSDTGVPGTLKSQTPILPVTLGHDADGEDVQLSMTSAVDSRLTTDMKEVLTRLDALEKTVSSIHSRAEERNTKQVQGEENLENLSAKQAEMEGKLVQIMIKESDHSENIENIFSLLSSMENNQQIRVKKLRTKIDDITKNQGKARKLQEMMIEDLKKKMDSLSEKVEEDLDKQIKTLSGKVGEISVQKTVAEMKEEISVSDKKLGDQIRNVEHRVSAVSEKVTEIDAATGKMSKKVIEIVVITEELSEKLDKIQERDGEKMKDFENKMLAVKRRRKKDFKDVETRYNKVELQYKMVCSIVADRLLGLERLRDILNKKILARDQMANTLPDTNHDLKKAPSSTAAECLHAKSAPPQPTMDGADAGGIAGGEKEAFCELCQGMFSHPVTYHMRQAHPGCGKNGGGKGYDWKGNFFKGWAGDCGEGGIGGHSWYIMCDKCREKYMKEKKPY